MSEIIGKNRKKRSKSFLLSTSLIFFNPLVEFYFLNSLKTLVGITVFMFKHTIINNNIVVILLLKIFKHDFCQLTLHVPPNHCLFGNAEMNHLVVIKITKNKTNRATKFALYFHIHIFLFFSDMTYFLAQNGVSVLKKKVAKYQFTFCIYS